MSDRTVHARLADGSEIVRYNRAGKWFREWPAGSMIPCEKLTVRGAASAASSGGGVGPPSSAKVFFGMPGGRIFDRDVKKAIDRRSLGLIGSTDPVDIPAGDPLSRRVDVSLWTVVMAIRYGMGRSTWANDDAADLAREHWDKFPGHIQEQIQRDVFRWTDDFVRKPWLWVYPTHLLPPEEGS